MLQIRTFALFVATVAAIVAVPVIAFAQVAPPDPSAADVVKLIASGQWLAAAIPAIILLDRALTDGEWPFSLIASTKVRLALVCFGSAGVTGLQMFVGGSAWLPSVLAGLAALVSALVANGKTLVGKGASVKVPGAAAMLLVLGLGGAAVGLEGCSWLQSPAGQVVEQDAAKVAECVIPKIVLGESPEQIAIECAVDLLTVQRIAAAHRAGSLKACPAVSR